MTDLYRSAAPYYLRGRPPYSPQLAATLRAELRLDGTGRLLDVGCGPGALTVELAPLFAEAVGLDPEPEMLKIAAVRAPEIRWLGGRAEDIPSLQLGTFRLVTFAQSFHWTDRERAAEAVYDVLESGGALALISQRVTRIPDGPGLPRVPQEEIRALVRRYVPQEHGPARHPDRFQDVLTRTRFGPPRLLTCPGREDLVQSVDEVVAHTFSHSFSAPELFGDRLAEFEAELRELLGDGPYWNWPGDTEVLLALKNP